MPEVVVARVGKPHGVRGEVTVEVRTDDPDRRLAVGAVLSTQPAHAGPLTITSRRKSGRLTLLAFDGVIDRNQAEELRGTLLVSAAESAEEPDAWHPHELAGFAVRHVDGTELGEVTDLVLGSAQDLLVVRCHGADVLVPFVKQIVPTIDAAQHVVTVDPPGGLFPSGPAAGESCTTTIPGQSTTEPPPGPGSTETTSGHDSAQAGPSRGVSPQQ